MKSKFKLPFGYFTLVNVIFIVGYVGLEIREMGLYLFLLFINLPSSLGVLPASEDLAQSMGVPAGGGLHVATTQFFASAFNSILLAILMASLGGITQKLKKSKKS